MCDFNHCYLMPIWAVYSVVSVFVYILLIYTIIRHRASEENFKSSFYVIVVSLGIADLSYFAIEWIFTRIRLLGWFKGFYETLEPLSSHIIEAPQGYVNVVQQMGVLLQSWNRYVCIVRSEALGKSDLSTKSTIIAIVLQWGFPSFLFGFSPFIHYEFEAVNGSTRLQIVRIAEFPWIVDMYFTVYIALSTIIILITALFYVGLFRWLRHYKRTLDGVTQNVTTWTQGSAVTNGSCMTNTERRLTLCALCNFVVLVSALIITALFSVEGQLISKLMSIIYETTVNVLCLANPCVLLICSETVRKYWLFEFRRLFHMNTGGL